MENQIYTETGDGGNDTRSADDRYSEERIRLRNQLFDEYIKPHLRLVTYLVKKYKTPDMDFDDAYNVALITLYNGIETYKPTMKLVTWIHIVVKRKVWALNQKESVYLEKLDGEAFDLSDEDQPRTGIDGDPTYTSLCLENYRQFCGDELLEALDSLEPISREVFILRTSGYSLAEIAKIQYDKDNISSANVEFVRSRMFFARQQMKKLITKDGKRRTDA